MNYRSVLTIGCAPSDTALDKAHFERAAIKQAALSCFHCKKEAKQNTHNERDTERRVAKKSTAKTKGARTLTQSDACPFAPASHLRCCLARSARQSRETSQRTRAPPPLTGARQHRETVERHPGVSPGQVCEQRHSACSARPNETEKEQHQQTHQTLSPAQHGHRSPGMYNTVCPFGPAPVPSRSVVTTRRADKRALEEAAHYKRPVSAVFQRVHLI